MEQCVALPANNNPRLHENHFRLRLWSQSRTAYESLLSCRQFLATTTWSLALQQIGHNLGFKSNIFIRSARNVQYSGRVSHGGHVDFVLPGRPRGPLSSMPDNIVSAGNRPNPAW